MKKNFLIFLLLLWQIAGAQILKYTETRNGITYSRHVLQSMSLVRPDDYLFAVDNQMGVLANNYIQPENIGTAPAEEAYINVFYPFDGMKRTIAGFCQSLFIRERQNSGDPDNDLNIEIRPKFSSARLLEDINSKRMNDVYLLAKNHSVVKRFVDANSILLHPRDVDLKNFAGYDVYNNALAAVRTKVAALRQYALVKSLKGIMPFVQSEIDIFKKYFPVFTKFSPRVPKQEIDYVAAYGAWVHDVGTGAVNPWASFHDYAEIHPAEQIWWVNHHLGNTEYNLGVFMDNSGRFNESSDFDHGSGEYRQPWVPCPMKEVFAITFETRYRHSPVYIDIENISDTNTRGVFNDGNLHYLLYNGDTIAVVKEPTRNKDYMNINFRDVGLDPYDIFKGDSIIRGLVTITAMIDATKPAHVCDPDNSAGHLLMKVTKKTPGMPVPYDNDRFKVSVTLDSIQCVRHSESSGDLQEELYGYIGAGVYSDKKPDSANILPDNDNNSLFFRHNDAEDAVKMKEGDVLRFTKTFIYTLNDKAVINIVADLNTDDQNEDHSGDLRDSGDDPLERADDYGGSVKRFTRKITDLPRNQPVTEHFTFRDAGDKSLFKVFFTIVKKRDTNVPATPPTK